MWILLRLIAMGIGFAVSRLNWSRKREDNNRIHGIAYSELKKTQNGRVTRFELSVPLDTGLVFVFTPEQGIDRLLKRIGLTEEFQTGDEGFDQNVYVGSEHPLLLNTLRNAAACREVVAQAFAAGFRRIWSDGRRLFAIAWQPLPAEHWVQKLARLGRAVELAASRSPGRLSDPFAARVLLVETALWSLAGYALVASLQMFGDVGPHFDPFRLVAAGCLASVPVFGVLGWAVLAFLQRSSRSHRVLVESGVLLALSLPVVGIQTAADLNRRFDSTPPVMVEARVDDKWSTTTKSTKGGRRTDYYARFTSLGELTLPSQLTVPVEIHRSLRKGRTASVEVGMGRLGFPYFRSVNGIAW